jgi:hypothetical protein
MHMARITITLPDERYEQLKLQAENRRTTVDQLVEESLVEAEEARTQKVREILDGARQHAASLEPPLTSEELMALAVEETRAVRREMAAERNARRHH